MLSTSKSTFAEGLTVRSTLYSSSSISSSSSSSSFFLLYFYFLLLLLLLLLFLLGFTYRPRPYSMLFTYVELKLLKQAGLYYKFNY
jgi:hypothetical protein